jgi:cell division protein FtsQ
VRKGVRTIATLVDSLDHALGCVLRPLANLMPRKLRRLAEKLEARRTRPVGQIAAVGFLLVTILYGLVAGGQISRLGDSLLVLVGFGIDDVRISGHRETSELAILERLEIRGSLVNFDVRSAQERVSQLPWVGKATVRKFYPGTLSVEIEERKPFALWQQDGEVLVIDRGGAPIVPLEESRFGSLPFAVGDGANLAAAVFFEKVMEEPDIAAQMRAAVFVADRRWDLHLENGVTVKLPEKNARQALAQLVKLNETSDLLARDVIVVDLRLPDRVTVRLPEGRTLDEVVGDDDAKKART